MQRSATAVWNGALKTGSGRVSTESKTITDTPYTFATRFESGSKGTNPEELLGASHAGCFTMMISALLGGEGFTPDSIETKATVTLEQVSGNWTITKIDLVTRAKIPGISAEKFAEVAGNAKAQCPISRVVKADISLDAKLA